MVGQSLPAAEFAAVLERAVRAARTGHCSFSDAWDVEVLFTVTDAGTDVRVRGLSEDDPESEFRVVGDTEYLLVTRSPPPWKSQDLTTADPADQFAVEGARLSTYIGNPLGLIQGLGTGAAVVVARSEGLTTFRVATRFGALARCAGDLTADPGIGDDEPTLWVVDDAGLALQVGVVAEFEGEMDFQFSDWGSAPEVVPPPADQVESQHDFLRRLGS